MLSARLAVLAAAGLAASVFAVYAVITAALFAIRAGVTMALPWWIALAAPLLLYGVLAAVALPRMSAAARLTGFAVLCGVHAAVASVTAVLVATVADISVATALHEASLSFMPAPLLQLLAVPLMLLPLRALLRRRPRAHRTRRVESELDRSRPRGETLPAWQSGRTAAPAAPDTGETAVAPRASGGPRLSLASAPPPAEPAAVFSVPGSAGPAFSASSRGALSPPAKPAADPLPVAAGTAAAALAREASPPPALAGVIPSPLATDAAAEPPRPAPGPAPAAADPSAPPDLTAPSLTAPSAPAAPVPVPAGPRVPEGDTVAIPFSRIATLLPADLLAWDVGHVSAELAAPGVLLVPIAVVVPQLPDGFVAVDWPQVMGQFPAAAFRVPVSEVAQRLPEGRMPLPLDEVVRRLPPEIFAMPAPEADLGTLESFPLPFQPLEAAPPLPAAPVDAAQPAAATPPAELPRAESAAPPSDAPAGEVAQAVPGETSGPDEAAADDEPADGEARLARLGRTLAPMGSLSGSVADLDGHGVYLFRPPSLAPETVLSAIGPALDVLRGPFTPSQLIVRMERGALVLTPLVAASGAASLVVAAAPLDGSLALLEILSLRCGVSAAAPAASPEGDGTLEPVAGGPTAELLAGALTAFGALAPSVIRDPEGRAELCLLHAPGEPARGLATVAHAACCALASMDSGGLGSVRSAVLRLPARPGGDARRLALRPVAGRPGHWIALAAPAGDARPGLVELEITRAAARAAR